MRWPSANASAMSWVTRITVVLQLPLNPREFTLQLDAGDRIERAERFVHQENRRIDGERPRHADSLTLAARELGRPARGERGWRQADEIEQRVRARPDAIGRPAFETRHQADVFLDGHVRKQPDVLQHVADAAPQADRVPLARVASLDANGSGRGQDQSIDELEDRALAGAAAADEHDDLPGDD